MSESQHNRIERDYEAQQREVERCKDADIIAEGATAGILEVRDGHRL